MENLNNDISELIKSHISIADKLLTNSLFDKSNGLDKTEFISQLDFLTFWVDADKMALHSPFSNDYLRDNPNWESTIYENVYKLVEEDKIVLQYVRDGFSPVAILQWYKMKIAVRSKEIDENGYKITTEEKRKISVYGKGLRLYYCGYLDWLPDYIDLYCGDVIRADICWDTKDKIPEGVVDLTNTITYGEGDNRTYKGFGNKRSPLFIRIYDKTLDLAKDHNSMAWLYPEWYTKSCWRIECKFTGRYAMSMNALQWLGVIERGGSIQKLKNPKRDYLKSAFYNLLMYIDWIPDRRVQYDLLDGIKNLVNKKLRKLKDFISLEDCENA